MGRSLLVLLVALCVPVAAAAQSGTVWLEPHGSWSQPTRDLGRTGVVAASGWGEFSRADPAPTLGLGVGVGLSSDLMLRLTADRLFESDVQGEWHCVPFIACPSVVIPLDGEMSRWSAVLDLQYRPGPNLPVGPVLSLGTGVARTRVEWNEPDIIQVGISEFTETAPVYRLGVGGEAGAGPVALVGEVRGTVLRFGGADYRSIEGDLIAPVTEPTTQFDLSFGAGVRIRIR